MSEQDPHNAYDEFEKASAEVGSERYLLRLFVAGNTQQSANTILKLRKICEEYLHGRYQLEVIDVYQQPELAKSDDVIATPTLVKYLPLPIRRMIGDLTKTDRVLVGLNLTQVHTNGKEPPGEPSGG